MSMKFDSYQSVNLSKIDSDTYLNTSKQSFNSPRMYFQRKPQTCNFQRRKRPAQKDLKNVFCYISPIRQLKQQNFQNNANHPQNTSLFDHKPNQNTQTSINFNIQGQPSQTLKHEPSKKILRVDSLNQLKNMNDQYRNQIYELKIKNIDYQKQIKILTVQKQKLEIQLRKIEHQLKNRENDCIKYKQAKEILTKSLEIQRKNKQNKEQLANYLADAVLQLNEKLEKYMSSDSSHLQKRQLQIVHIFQKQLFQLRQSLKYYAIENNILKKKTLQIKNQKQQIYQLKESNKKLSNRINNLNRIKHRFISNHQYYDSIFQLSPERD